MDDTGGKPIVKGSIQRAKCDEAMAKKENATLEDSSPSNRKIAFRFRLNWHGAKEAIYISAALAGICGVAIWLFETADRQEDRINRKIQLASSGLEILRRSLQSEADPTMLRPSPQEMGLAMLAIGRASDRVHLSVDRLQADCGGNEVMSAITVASRSVDFYDCKFFGTEDITVELSDGPSTLDFTGSNLGPRMLDVKGDPHRISFTNSTLLTTVLRVGSTQKSLISFEGTRADTVSVIASLSGRGGGWTKIFNLPLINQSDRMVFDWRNHDCDRIENRPRVRGSYEVYRC